MTLKDILSYRLYNQKLIETTCKNPAEVVYWLGAMQSQDYFGVKWALGLRMKQATDTDLEKAFTEGSILRTHVMRPTWHFVTPADIRWLLALTAPRVNAVSAYYFRQVGLDDSVFNKSNEILAKSLQGGKQLTRAELGEILHKGGIDTKVLLRLTYLMIRAELDGVVCSGTRRGKQFTYALLEERVPKVKLLDRDEALAELTKRYFISHGPAQMQDFIWWSGLTFADAKRGLEMNKSEIIPEVVEEKIYWLAKSLPTLKEISNIAYLLPNYDEYGISYKDRSAFYNPTDDIHAGAKGALPYPHMIVINGHVVGMWKRVIKKNSIIIQTRAFSSFSTKEKNFIAEAAHRFELFHNTPVILQ